MTSMGATDDKLTKLREFVYSKQMWPISVPFFCFKLNNGIFKQMYDLFKHYWLSDTISSSAFENTAHE